MTDLFNLFSAAGSQLLSLAGMPVLVWTVFAALLLLLLHRIGDRLHAGIHYHVRLALLAGLPAGILLAYAADLAAAWLSAGSSEPITTIRLIVVPSPVEIIFAEPAASAPAPLLFTSAFWYGMLTIVLAAGTAWFFVKWLVDYLRLNRFRRRLNLQPVHSLTGISGQNRQLAKACARPVQVAFSSRPVIPVTFGARRPVILLPAELSGDPEKMNLVLRHELMHIRNRDYETNLATTGILTVFWFHPLVHLLHRQLVDYREIRCDSLVLSGGVVSRKKYASLLLELLMMPNLNRNVSVNMAQESSNLKKRINMMKSGINNHPTVKTGFLYLTGTFLAAILIMACTDLQTVSNGSASEATAEAQESGEPAVQLDQMPEPVDRMGMVQSRIRYPEEARRNGTTGHVHARFTVTEQGEVENEEIVRSAGSALDEEVLRVVRGIEFTPAMRDGEPVGMQVSFPVEFRMMIGSEQHRDGNGEVTSPDGAALDHVVVIGYGSAN